jgi:hypothetical protein
MISTFLSQPAVTAFRCAAPQFTNGERAEMYRRIFLPNRGYAQEAAVM